MQKVRVMRAVDEATDNCQKLACCDDHQFVPEKGLPHQRKYRCSRCGGEVDSQTYHWYAVGRAHGAALKSPAT